jgi:hypothetical protein
MGKVYKILLGRKGEQCIVEIVLEKPRSRNTVSTRNTRTTIYYGIW